MVNDRATEGGPDPTREGRDITNSNGSKILTAVELGRNDSCRKKRLGCIVDSASARLLLLSTRTSVAVSTIIEFLSELQLSEHNCSPQICHILCQTLIRPHEDSRMHAILLQGFFFPIFHFYI